MLNKAALYYRTVRRMKPGMAVSRLLGQHKLAESTFDGEHFGNVPRIAIFELDLDPLYLARFDTNKMCHGEFFLINEWHQVDRNTWSVPEASHLWNFNLHYFEWGVALAAQWRTTHEKRYFDCFKTFVSSWIQSCRYSDGDAWHPYTISLRLINWLIAIELFDGEVEEDSEFFDSMRESMYSQYRHLFVNQEMHLRANHWWENLKTLIIMSAMFGEHDVHSCVMRHFESQIDEQILPDGVHYERSMMYHKLVLEGMLRVYLASKQLNFDLPDNYLQKMKAMLDAMASIEKGMGKTPFFNDSADGVAKTGSSLVLACRAVAKIKEDDTITSFQYAGFYKLYEGNIAVVFFAGEPGPSFMLGHSHCDLLSYEVSVNEKPILVNAGTYAYQSKLRPYFRSTEAHNTAMILNGEQMECWSEHRVARGVKNINVSEKKKNSLVAKYKTYQGVLHERNISLKNNALFVSDRFGCSGKTIVSFIHLAPSVCALVNSLNTELSDSNHQVEVLTDSAISVNQGIYSPEFGIIDKTVKVMRLRTDGNQISYSVKL